MIYGLLLQNPITKIDMSNKKSPGNTFLVQCLFVNDVGSRYANKTLLRTWLYEKLNCIKYVNRLYKKKRILKNMMHNSYQIELGLKLSARKTYFYFSQSQTLYLLWVPGSF